MESRPHVPGERRSLPTDTPDPLDPPAAGLPRKPYLAPRVTHHGSVVAQTAQAPAPDATSQIASDRSLKEGVAAVDPRQVLAKVATLPIATWSYKGETVRHLGPMAQDFFAAFGLGADDRHIHAGDASGVALAALQGLHALVQAQATRLAVLEAEVAALRAVLEECQLERIA